MNLLDKTLRINRITMAALQHGFGERLNDIDVLKYIQVENGKKFIYEDRFDYVDPATTPCTVCFIAGTGFEDVRVPLSQLTDNSIRKLFDCIED